jgi:hypothetical protein
MIRILWHVQDKFPIWTMGDIVGNRCLEPISNMWRCLESLANALEVSM